MNAIHAANVLAVMGVFDIIGSLLAGWLTERIDSRLILAFTYGVRGIALFLLPVAFHQGA
ncbi:hypothetical protein ATO00_01685 [Loigolactobacillus coryniformis subsp. coryniformis]|nr:hypothetical protein ATO00_01685 [Loigolactobacillus coryniformis subsp. coryniformis]